MLCMDEFNFGAKALVKEGMVGIKGEIAVQKNKNCVLGGNHSASVGMFGLNNTP